jgi:hypothetical protein
MLATILTPAANIAHKVLPRRRHPNCNCNSDCNSHADSDPYSNAYPMHGEMYPDA